MATPDEIKLQKGTIAPTQKEQTGSAKAVSLIESLAAGTPSLPKGTTISPQLQQAQKPELLGQPGQAAVTVTGQTPGTGLSASVPTTVAAPAISAPGALTAATTTAPTAQTAQTMTAAQVAGSTPTVTAAQGQLSTGAVAQAAQGTITSDATVKGQLQSLQNAICCTYSCTGCCHI